MNKKNRGQRGLILSCYNRPTNHITLELTHVCSGTLKLIFYCRTYKVAKNIQIDGKKTHVMKNYIQGKNQPPMTKKCLKEMVLTLTTNTKNGLKSYTISYECRTKNY